MRILVTGAGGFVGNYVATALAKRHHKVLATVHRSVPDSLRSSGEIEVTAFDLAATDALKIDGKIDAVIHCAAALPSTVPDPDQLYRTNVNGMERLIAATLEAGAGTFINCSSMSIYGRIEVPLVEVDTPRVDPDAYGRSKFDSEMLLCEAADKHGIAALSIRLPGIVGRGSHDNFLSAVMAKILAGEPVQARNPDALFNNIVHVSDLAHFMTAQFGSLQPGHRATTIAADPAIAIRKVMSLMFAEAGRPEDISYSKGGVPFLINPEAARSLGFQVPTTEASVLRFARDCST